MVKKEEALENQQLTGPYSLTSSNDVDHTAIICLSIARLSW